MGRPLWRRLGRIVNTQARQQRISGAGKWAAIERQLLDACHPKQRAFVLDPSRRVSGVVARGGGKTTGGRARLVRRMGATRNAKCLYIAQTRSMAEELMWAPLKQLAERAGVPAHFSESKLRMTVPQTGATLRLVGADDKREIEKLRGQPFHEVHIDEAASLTLQIVDHLVHRIIGPRLGDYGGVLVMYGTPGHILKGEFYDATRPGADENRRWSPDVSDDGWQGWSSHHWSLQDAAAHVPAMARLWDEAHVNKETNGWSDDHPVWRREYLGYWAADDTEMVFRYRPHLDDGAPWNQWDPPRDSKTGIAELPPGHEWGHVYGLDLGHSDPTAIEVFAYSLTDKCLYHIYEFNKAGMHPKSIAQVLIGEELNADRPGGLFGATGWPSDIVADTAGLGGMFLDEFRNVYGIAIEPAEKKDKHDAIELFNGDLIDGRIKILKGSELETQLLHLQWAQNDYGDLKEDRNQRNDCADAAVYGRRRAMHRYAGDPLPPGPPPGTPEALDRAMDESEDARVRSSEDEFSSMLSDDGYYEDWG